MKEPTITLCKVCKQILHKRCATQTKCRPCSNKQSYTKVIPSILECPNCKESFTSTHKNQKICSKACQDKYRILEINEHWHTKERELIRKSRAHNAFNAVNFCR